MSCERSLSESPNLSTGNRLQATKFNYSMRLRCGHARPRDPSSIDTTVNLSTSSVTFGVQRSLEFRLPSILSAVLMKLGPFPIGCLLVNASIVNVAVWTSTWPHRRWRYCSGVVSTRHWRLRTDVIGNSQGANSLRTCVEPRRWLCYAANVCATLTIKPYDKNVYCGTLVRYLPNFISCELRFLRHITFVVCLPVWHKPQYSIEISGSQN